MKLYDYKKIALAEDIVKPLTITSSTTSTVDGVSVPSLTVSQIEDICEAMGQSIPVFIKSTSNNCTIIVDRASDSEVENKEVYINVSESARAKYSVSSTSTTPTITVNKNIHPISSVVIGEDTIDLVIE